MAAPVEETMANSTLVEDLARVTAGGHALAIRSGDAMPVPGGEFAHLGPREATARLPVG